MPIGKIESNKQVDYKLVYGRANGMPNSLKSMVVCSNYRRRLIYVSLQGRDSEKQEIVVLAHHKQLLCNFARAVIAKDATAVTIAGAGLNSQFDNLD